MKRLLTLALILGAATLATPANAEPGWRLTECRFQGHDGRAGWVRYEVKATIRCAAPKFGVSTSTAIYVAGRESGFRQYARNPSSGACGVFQHIPRYFPGRLTNVPTTYKSWGSSCFDARSNILAALKLAQAGWGPWSVI